MNSFSRTGCETVYNQFIMASKQDTSGLGSLLTNQGRGDIDRLVESARDVLRGNQVGNFTRPSLQLYPHQWSWDTAFIAIGYSTFDEVRAEGELTALFEAQWANGMVPHIVFNDDAEGGYFPGPDFWDTGRAEAAPAAVRTSGITQPPVHATAALCVYRRAEEKDRALAWLRELYPKLLASHRFFYTERDPFDEGLVYIRHPWESGLDNSPTWDGPLSLIDPAGAPDYTRQDLNKGVGVAERPSGEDYDRYIYLLELFKRHDYDEASIFSECPFLVQDTLVNAVLSKANADLAEIGRIIGEPIAEVEIWVERTKRAVREKLWHEGHGFFDDFDLRSNKLIEVDTADGFSPLYGGAATKAQARRLYAHLESASFCPMHQGNCFSIPNYNMQGIAFSPDNYWRGPIWININWMLAYALDDYGFNEKAQSVRQDIIELVHRFGFHEYFDPYEGRGYGSENFSWTAALFLDVVQELVSPK